VRSDAALPLRGVSELAGPVVARFERCRLLPELSGLLLPEAGASSRRGGAFAIAGLVEGRLRERRGRFVQELGERVCLRFRRAVLLLLLLFAVQLFLALLFACLLFVCLLLTCLLFTRPLFLALLFSRGRGA